MTQTLLHHGEDIPVTAAFGIKQPLRRQPRPGERRREEIAAAQRPQHNPALPRPPRRKGSEEQAGGGIIGKAGTRARTFVKRGK